MGYITEIGLNSRFFQGKGAYQLVYPKNSGTLPLMLYSIAYDHDDIVIIYL